MSQTTDGAFVDVTHLRGESLGLAPDQRIYSHIPATPTPDDPLGFRTLPSLLLDLIELREKEKARQMSQPGALTPQELLNQQKAEIRKISENSMYGLTSAPLPRCAKCSKPRPQLSCSVRCRAKYCNEGCRGSDREVHKHVCTK